ncbi:hypothetical protein LG198_02830 [Methylobacillus arboreus]|uniref:hypothetical protein n=1 Tax=Methylobacillus arboreus TaxID=755170 RepID=UPI001E4674B4|nr:hypothetical protein [Methylobacillus arboreus]MCB5189668.1 hypothetical protein [Methylobacillus arboreus]
MAILVTGVRFNENGKEVTHVEWGTVYVYNPKRWVTQPQVTDVHDLINALNEGTMVQSRFVIGGDQVLGPALKLKSLASGGKTIQMAQRKKQQALSDLPHV